MTVHKIVGVEDVPVEERGNGRYYIRRVLDEMLSTPPESVGVYFTSVRSYVAEHHHRNLDEILIFLTPAAIEINGERYEMQKYDSVFLPRGTNHKIYSNNDQESMLIAVKMPNAKEDKVETK